MCYRGPKVSCLHCPLDEICAIFKIVDGECFLCGVEVIPHHWRYLPVMCMNDVCLLASCTYKTKYKLSDIRVFDSIHVNKERTTVATRDHGNAEA